MKQSNLLVPNVENTINDEEAASSLLIEGGFLGEYQENRVVFLPLGMLVMEKIKKIVLEELHSLSAIEFQLPVAVADQGETYLLQLLTEGQLATSRELLNIFQIQVKVEQNKEYQFPGGIALEPTELDGYSFHSASTELSEVFHRFEQAFQRILARCQLEYKSVIALPQKAIHKEIKDLLAISSAGKTIFCESTQGDYSAKVEAATRYSLVKKSHATFLPLERKIPATGFKLDDGNQLTCYFLRASKKPILLFLAKNDRLNLAKISQKMQHKVVEIKKQEVEKYFGISYELFSFDLISPDWIILADLEVENRTNMTMMNPDEASYYENINLGRDLPNVSFGDFSYVQEGDLAPDGKGTLLFKKGVKIGQFMKKMIAQKTSDTANEEEKKVYIGHYQLSLSLLFLMIAKQHHKNGHLNWPEEVAPFDLHILPIDYQNSYQQVLAQEVEEMMVAKGYEVLIDDRDSSLEEKQKDADLISCPVEIVIGEKAVEGVVEIKIRASQAVVEVRKEELADTLAILLQTTE